MRKNIHSFIILLKPLSCIPALLMMFLIFSYSSQNGTTSGSLSQNISYKIVSAGSHLMHLKSSDKDIQTAARKIEYPLRKLAHMTEYFIFALAVLFSLYVYGLRGLPLLLTAGFICVCFAGSDEYHQSFVSGREPSIRDVGIDSIGIFLGLYCGHHFHKI